MPHWPWAGWWASPRDLPVSASSEPGLSVYTTLPSFSALQVLGTEVGSSFLYGGILGTELILQPLSYVFNHNEYLKPPQCSPPPASSNLLFPLALVTLVPWRQPRLWPLDERLRPAGLQPGGRSGHSFVSVHGLCGS